MKAQMNVKEFMETQKNSNAKEVYVMYSHPYTSFLMVFFPAGLSGNSSKRYRIRDR